MNTKYEEHTFKIAELIKNYKLKKQIKYTFVIFWLFLLINPLYSQIKQSHSFVVGFLQLKDKLDLGMVFNGIQLEYRYGLHWNINGHEIIYEPKLGAGIAFSRYSIPGNVLERSQIHFSPVNVTWTMPAYDQNGHTIRAGVNFITDYNYLYCEDLHDSPLFWTCEIGLSPVMQYSYQWDNKRISAAVRNSIFGFTSHTQRYDPYFWQSTWKDILVKPHKELKIGSFNDYNHTNVSLEFFPNISKMHSFAYEFDYSGFFTGNKLERINHNVLWRLSR